MGRNARKRISYVLPLVNSAGGHRLGVNGLAVDPYNSILYSGGRDGVICAWDLNLDLRPPHDRENFTSLSNNLDDDAPHATPDTLFRQQVQAHTHWINDITLAQNNEALVSASSDVSVKLWRPAAHEATPPQTIGLHSDYVKCLASPSPTANWVASGGLDRKINLWDLNGAGQTLQIGVEDESAAKGSVYALAATNTLVAGGGPESIVRVWDARSGKRITKFVGHTDNIRDVMIAEGGDTIMTASSDQTVKVWSMTAGRCMYTLTMHNDSVWSLYSDHPQLSVFYSSDRSGLVAKTDVRGCIEMDEGISVGVCQEHEGVNKVVAAGNYLWTGTCSSSINRWLDVNTEADVQMPDYKHHRLSSATNRTRLPSPTSPTSPPPTASSMATEKIPRSALLRMSNAASFHLYHRDLDSSTVHSSLSVRKPSEALMEDENGVTPVRGLPDFSIEGQNGLIKHVLLNDRRRVLTLDTAGEVTLWDLLQCAPIKSFGKRHLEDVAPEVNTTETVAHWCAVDTRTGSLTCVLEENYCFDAEMYADELELEEPIEFREDQRINLGKWILRYLFANLIDEEIKRDEAFREWLLNEKKQRGKSPGTIQIPQSTMNGWKDGSAPSSATTLRANGGGLPLHTPGLAIGVATPAAAAPPVPASHPTALPPTAEEGTNLEKSTSRGSQDRASGDYFSQQAPPLSPSVSATPRDSNDEGIPQSPSMEKDSGKEGTMFGRKFKMSFGMGRKLSRTPTTETSAAGGNNNVNKTGSDGGSDEKTPTTHEGDSDERSSTKTEDRIIEDSFLGVVQTIRHKYEDDVNEGAQTLTSAITPSLANETPVLKPPLNTTILIQEDRLDAGGVADLFEGKVGNLAQQADLIEKVAPKWLGEVLLRNSPPLKEIVKVSFILEPHASTPQLPPIATDGNNRLNANRMLRARKIMAYVAERIEPAPEQPDPDALRPEEYLELYCNGQLIPPTMTLATIRAHEIKHATAAAAPSSSSVASSSHTHQQQQAQGTTAYSSSTPSSPRQHAQLGIPGATGMPPLIPPLDKEQQHSSGGGLGGNASAPGTAVGHHYHYHDVDGVRREGDPEPPARGSPGAAGVVDYGKALPP
ncbi:WD repeat protein-like protein [Phyllosticta citriasiana]|uniref:WD repeat protein-like protein n=1 Tax=Phyllosticta citriasiana TaxID=595635 RepID=A0ABR1KB90_9PEZI